MNVDGTPYEVSSAGEFVTDSTGTASCTQGSASADYIRITSTVSWPSIGSRPPALVQSLVAPPNGSISDTAGRSRFRSRTARTRASPVSG